MPEEIVSLVATRFPHDVRAMTGALRKILAYASFVEQELTYDFADEILGQLGAEPQE